MSTVLQVYVGNLDPSTTEGDLREFFSDCGDIVSVGSARMVIAATFCPCFNVASVILYKSAAEL